jgi:hypothetical protein
MSALRLLPLAALPFLLAACGSDNGNTAPPATPPAAPVATVPVAPAPATPAPAAPAAPAPAAPAGQSASGDLGFLWGRWSADLARCDSAAIAISETRFEGAENSCALSGLTDTGDGSYSARLACTSQGSQNSERLAMTPVFTPTGEGLVLVYPDRGPERITLLRCSR